MDVTVSEDRIEKLKLILLENLQESQMLFSLYSSRNHWGTNLNVDAVSGACNQIGFDGVARGQNKPMQPDVLTETN